MYSLQLQSANKSSKSSRNYKKALVEDEKSKLITESDIQPQTSSSKDGPFADTDFVSSTVNQLLSLNSEIGSSFEKLSVLFANDQIVFHYSSIFFRSVLKIWKRRSRME